MEAIEPSSLNTPPVKAKKSLWSQFKTIVFISSFLGLGSFNFLTLLNDGVHNAAYNTLKSILSTVIPDVALSNLLSKSTSVKRQADVQFATKRIQAEKDLLAAAQKNIEGKHLALQKSFMEVEAKHNELKRISTKNSAVAMKISKRLAARTAIAATRNTTSVPAKAIPWVGASIIVGMTAWEISDACESVKDLNELNSVFGQELEDQAKICGLKVPTKEEAFAQIMGNWQATYQAAAETLNKGGVAAMSLTPPKVNWSDIKGIICPVLGSVPMFCL